MNPTQNGLNTLPPKEDAGPRMLAESYILFTVACVLLAIRCYGRLCLTKNWGWDDTTIIVAWVCSAFFQATVLAHMIADFSSTKHCPNDL